MKNCDAENEGNRNRHIRRNYRHISFPLSSLAILTSHSSLIHHFYKKKETKTGFTEYSKSLSHYNYAVIYAESRKRIKTNYMYNMKNNMEPVRYRIRLCK